MRSLAFMGRYLVVGFASGEIPRIPLNLLLLKTASLVGVFWGAYARTCPQHNAANFAELFAWYAQGLLKPHVSESFPLADYAQALDAVMNRRAKGKVVLLVQLSPVAKERTAVTQAVSFLAHGRIAIAAIDNPPVNALSHAVRAGLTEALARTQADPTLAALVIVCRGRTFCAGADVREFGKPFADPQLGEVVARTEASAKPVIAAHARHCTRRRARSLPWRATGGWRCARRAWDFRRSSSASSRELPARSACRAWSRRVRRSP